MHLERAGMAVAAVASCLSLATQGAEVATTDNYLPMTHHMGAVAYVTGGVGKDEADAIRHAAPQYSLEIEFLRKTRPQDEYLAEVKVRIQDLHNRAVLDVTSDGPFVLATLPVGRYTVSARYDGLVQQREVQVITNAHQHVVFEWQS